MPVRVPGAAVGHGREAVERHDRAIVLEGPTHVVAVPTRLHMGGQDQLGRVPFGGDAQERAEVKTGAPLGADGEGWRGRLGIAGKELVVGDERHLLILPVPKAAAVPFEILDVHDRRVSSFEHELTAVVDVAQLEPGAVAAAAVRGAQPAHLPERIRTRPADQVLVAGTYRLGRLGDAAPDENRAEQGGSKYANANCQWSPRLSRVGRAGSRGRRFAPAGSCRRSGAGAPRDHPR